MRTITYKFGFKGNVIYVGSIIIGLSSFLTDHAYDIVRNAVDKIYDISDVKVN